MLHYASVDADITLNMCLTLLDNHYNIRFIAEITTGQRPLRAV